MGTINGRSAALLAACASLIFGAPAIPVRAATPCAAEFAPQEGMVAVAERPFRDDLSLNGRWQFQPIPIPAGYVRDQGTPPNLALPDAARWEATPIKIPSPWNVNTWGGGRDVGAGTAHPYWPGSVAFPSYPASWDGVEMGWLRRSFRTPAKWTGRRVLLHFDAVAGECQVRINGQTVGSHFDSFLPFTFDITPFLHPGSDNELLVGVRRRHLFNKTDARYPHFRAPYPPGSNTDALGGIWQDVGLIAVAPVHVSDTFVRSEVSADHLRVDVTLTNSGASPRTVRVGATAAPWINLAGAKIADAPVPRGRLAAPALSLPGVAVTVPGGGSATVTLQVAVKGRLKLWSPDAPSLNGLVVSVMENGKTTDRKYTRFGWRELKLAGQYLLLNGKKIQMYGDLVHPFGAFTMSRRYAWAWYRMIKDMHGNAVRLHAQPMPPFYLDLADEMGLLVLDETALFGSSLQLNFEQPVAWQRYADHYDALVQRDRNHPCVFGWSFGNELFAIFEYNHVPVEQADQWYARLADLGLRARKLDPTREWISCDGDLDLRGTLPIWAKHLGDGLHLDAIADIDKPRMVGESGGTYYAKPPRLRQFNGDRAYMSYRGRDEALAIDAYQNVVKMARPLLAFYSESETVWFGLEPLPYGYSDTFRLPNASDGVIFTRPYVEGKPGWQVERIPPYAATLNPGWDSGLPLYRPLPLFDALKAALAPGQPAPSPWDHLPKTVSLPAIPPSSIEKAAFRGARGGNLYRQLVRWGVPLIAADAPGGVAGLLIIDGATVAPGEGPTIKRELAQVLSRGGIALVLLGDADSPASANAFLPSSVALTARTGTMLTPDQPSPWTAALEMPDLYFAENPADTMIVKRGLTGPFVEAGRTLLRAGDIDWTLFDAGEAVKCGALVLYEHLQKPAGAAFVVHEKDGGRIAVSTIATGVTDAHAELWRKLLAGMGVRLTAFRAQAAVGAAGPEHDLLRDGPTVK
jgi:beta-galactosidase